MVGSGLVTRPPNTGRQRVAFALLGCVQVTLIAAITLLTVALPAVRADLRTGQAGLVFASSAYGVAFGGFLLLGGRVADLVGHRRALVAAMSAFALACAGASLAPTTPLLIATRFGQGMAAALAAPAAMALLGPVFPDPARRARAVATWGVFASVGATLGNVLSGLIVTAASWRWVFVVPAVLSIALAVVLPRLVPAGPPPDRTRLDLPGAATVTAGLAIAIYGMGNGSAGWIAAGAALLVGFVLIELRSATPLLPMSLLLVPRRVIALLAIALTAAGMTVDYFILALYLQEIRAYSPLATSAMFALPALVLLAAGPLAGRVRARLGAWPLLVAGQALAGAGCLLLAGIGHGSPGGGQLLAGLVVFALGAGMSFSISMVLAVPDSSAGRAGVSAAVANTAMEVGPPLGLAVLIPIAAGYAAARGHLPLRDAVSQGYGLALTVAAVAFVCMAAIALTVRLTIGKETGEES